MSLVNDAPVQLPVYRWGRLGHIAILLGLVCVLWTVEALAITVSLSSSPPADAIRPDYDVARVTLAVERDGQPLTHGHLQVKVTAPPQPKLLSTDFPVVEATTLLELASELKDGTFSFDYLFPIRGEYTFDVALQPIAGASEFAPTSVQTPWQLYESPAEVRNVWLLVVGLFGLGGVLGLVLARSARAQSALLLAVFAVPVALGMQAESLAQGQAETAKAKHVVRGEQGWALEVHPTPDQGTVGQQVRFDMRLTKDGEVFAGATEMSLELHHIEDDKSIFQTDILASAGETSQRLQFFDGAPHRVTVTARPASSGPGAASPLQAVFDMDVNGIQPPMAVKLRTMGLLIGVLVIGMVAGWLCPVKSTKA